MLAQAWVDSPTRPKIPARWVVQPGAHWPGADCPSMPPKATTATRSQPAHVHLMVQKYARQSTPPPAGRDTGPGPGLHSEEKDFLLAQMNELRDELAALVRRHLCLLFPPPSWPRHCLCLVFPPPSWLRHRLCLVFPPPSWLRHRLCLVFPPPSRLRHCLSIPSSGRRR